MTQAQEQLTENEAAILNSARGQLKAFVDKLRLLADEAGDALVAMDTRLEEFDAGSRRVEPTDAEKKQRAR